MRLLKQVRVGFVLTPGFRAADVVAVQSVLGIHPRTECEYVAASRTCVRGKSGFPIVATSTFEECPPLDVLVVGEQPSEALDDPALLQFLARQVEAASQVVAVSNGVVALAKAGCLARVRVTADARSLPTLRETQAVVLDQAGPVVDGKFHTAGPCTGAIEAAFVVLEALRGTFWAKLAELTLEYDPHPAYSGADVSPKAFAAVDRFVKVAVLCPPGMYVPDVMGAVDVLGSLPGAEVFYVWKDEGAKKGILGPTLVADTTFEACPPVDVIIVGATPPQVCAEPEALAFLAQREPEASAVISVCAGVLVAGAAGLLEDRPATTNFHMYGLLGSVGAHLSEQHTVSAGKVHTAGPAVGSYEVGLRVVAGLFGEEVAALIERDVLEYRPRPVFGVGRPALAGPWLTTISKAALLPALPFYRLAVWLGRRRTRRLPGAAIRGELEDAHRHG
jgi:cyclohexyl-isocyanide hydratase